jgi:hypothetical protein
MSARLAGTVGRYLVSRPSCASPDAHHTAPYRLSVASAASDAEGAAASSFPHPTRALSLAFGAIQ